MFIRVKERPNGKKSIQIVETYRKGTKVHQKIFRHVGQAITDSEVETLKKLAESIIINTKNEKQPVLPMFSPEKIYSITPKKKPCNDRVRISNLREEQRVIEGIGEIFGKLYSEVGFDDVLDSPKKATELNAILKTCVISRIANPVSKRRTASLLEEDYGIKLPLEKIYRMMDQLSDQENKVKDRVCKSTYSLLKEEVDVLFFDVTTLYFESIKKDELKDFGFSKDCKFKETQVVLALVTTSEGLPITYELFPGNMYEGHTLIHMIKKLKEVHNIKNILLVADRAMFNSDNLKYMESENINYIVAATLKKLTKGIKKSIIKSSDYKPIGCDHELQWIKELEYKERRLIVSYSAKRAEKDAKDRQRLIDRLFKKIKKDKIPLKSLIPNYGSKKYIEIKKGEASINESKIEEDELWDGLHGIITNMKDKPARDILARYHDLWQIEEAFRINKHNLKMRPIYHWSPHRIKAHILICFLAFTLAKQATYRMKHQQISMSFEQIRNELLHVQASIVVDTDSKKKYILPSHVTINQKKIYQAFGLKRSEVPYLLEK